MIDNEGFLVLKKNHKIQVFLLGGPSTFVVARMESNVSRESSGYVWVVFFFNHKGVLVSAGNLARELILV